MRGFIVGVTTALALSGCGDEPTRLEVLVNQLGLVKSSVGASPKDLPARDLAPRTGLRFTKADVQGDTADEIIVELPSGAGVAIQDATGQVIDEIKTAGYLTDFGTIESADARRAPKHDIVLYTYPNASRGGTFQVVTTRSPASTPSGWRPPATRMRSLC